jgi:hypothetical protein
VTRFKRVKRLRTPSCAIDPSRQTKSCHRVTSTAIFSTPESSRSFTPTVENAAAPVRPIPKVLRGQKALVTGAEFRHRQSRRDRVGPRGRQRRCELRNPAGCRRRGGAANPLRGHKRLCAAGGRLAGGPGRGHVSADGGEIQQDRHPREQCRAAAGLAVHQMTLAQWKTVLDVN